MLLDSCSEPSQVSHDDDAHTVQFYETDEALLGRLSEFVGSALGSGHACLVIATTAHRNSLTAQLSAFGMNVQQVMEDGRLILLDAAETLDLFMKNGWPDAGRFAALMDGLLFQCRKTAGQQQHYRLSVFGEMVALLAAEGKSEAAIQLEQMWNDLAKRYAFSLMCAYPMRTFSREEDEISFKQICAEHSEVRPCESYGGLPDESARLLTHQWTATKGADAAGGGAGTGAPSADPFRRD